jgi:hypothetical protein
MTYYVKIIFCNLIPILIHNIIRIKSLGKVFLLVSHHQRYSDGSCKAVHKVIETSLQAAI